MKIKLFATGGTFEKVYHPITQTLSFEESHLLEIFTMGRSELDLTLEVLFLKDSLQMTDEDRALILEKCMNTDEEKIVITHGTDTMTKTAGVLAEKIKDKTIVLTGAMVPFGFRSSDAEFNLGSAMGFVQTLPHGVYIAMNGRVSPHDQVRKNLETGVFEIVKN